MKIYLELVKNRLTIPEYNLDLSQVREYLYGDDQVSFEIILVGFMMLFNYFLFEAIWRYLPSSSRKSLYISALHSFIVASYAVYKIVEYYQKDYCGVFGQDKNYLCLSALFEKLGFEISRVFLCFSTIVNVFVELYQSVIYLIGASIGSVYATELYSRDYTIPATADLVYMYILSLTLTYSFFDLEKLSSGGELLKNSKIILFHHIGMFSAIVVNMSLFLFKMREYEYLLCLGFLSELSTPLLNYLKIRHHNKNPAPVWMYRIFIAVYFFCRPVTLSYIMHGIREKIDEGKDYTSHLNTLLAITISFLLLNLGWFYLIIRKFTKGVV